jgi:hypothetical protein
MAVGARSASSSENSAAAGAAPKELELAAFAEALVRISALLPVSATADLAADKPLIARKLEVRPAECQALLPSLLPPYPDSRKTLGQKDLPPRLLVALTTAPQYV